MPFERTTDRPRRIAVIGGGISGLAAAWLLRDRALVTLYEAAPRFGGHARTVLAGRRGDQPVDMGFIVFNHVNYPHLTRLFETLDVPTIPSDMSFGASFGGGAFEYGLSGPRAILAQPSNLLRPAFARMIRDILKFNREAKGRVQGTGMTIGDLLDALGTGPWFRDRYLLPFSGAIWSTPARDILGFPAETLVRFFDNHALMQSSGQHQWHTVAGGSREYVSRLTGALDRAGVELRLNTPVSAVRRHGQGVEVAAGGAAPEAFDEVVFATHSDQALGLLSDADAHERRNLGAVRTQPNRAVLHRDARVMPKRRAVWSSWTYAEPADGVPDRIALTYWMNRLQSIPESDPLFVTLNPAAAIDPAAIYDETEFHHPVYDAPAAQARTAIRARNGTRRTWFCGAWMHDGFHEDGFQSAVDVVSAMSDRRADAG